MQLKSRLAKAQQTVSFYYVENEQKLGPERFHNDFSVLGESKSYTYEKTGKDLVLALYDAKSMA